VDQFLAEKRPGKPAGSPSRKLSPSPLGNGQADASVEGEAPPVPLELVPEGQPAFDEKTAQQVVEIAVGLLNDAASAIVRAIAKKETGDEALADEAAESVRMDDKIATTVKAGGVACCKKYSVNLAYAPEFMLFGGLVVWAGGVVGPSVKALRAKGAELRAEAEKEKKAA